MLVFILHARLWVHRAPGIPCALCLLRGWNVTQSSGASRRENADTHPLTTLCRHAREGGHPVIRGFSAEAEAPLGYWIVRSSRTMTAESCLKIESEMMGTSRRRAKLATSSGSPCHTFNSQPPPTRP